MAKKLKTEYVCRECGNISSKWGGKCLECGAWSSLEERAPAPEKTRGLSTQASGAQKLRDIDVSEQNRLHTGNAELDRALGGGFAPGSLLLIGGDPGIGKSTLLLQTMANLAAAGKKALYVSGEESAQQVKLRSSRLESGGSDMLLLCETSLPKVLDEAKKMQPDIMVIDSIQTLFQPELNGTPGTVTQLRECTLELMVFAKQTGCITILVGHVTKEGQIAGPKILEHMVDTVIYFEGESNGQFRILRAIKNRFGATDEIGVFEMTARGLMPVGNPSLVFLQQTAENAPGSVITSTMEGTRALLLEIQALVSTSGYSVAQRVAMGVDPRRLTIILALLEKFAGMEIGNSDVFVSVAGGLKVNDPGTDLAIALAIASNHLGKELPARIVALGELGLAGDLRAVSQLELRLREISRLGFHEAVIPAHVKVKAPQNLKVHRFSTLNQAVQELINDI